MKGEIDLFYNNKIIPLRLATDPQAKQKMLTVSDLKVMSPLYTNERPVEARIPYLKETFLFQDTFNGGCGQLNLDNPTRYYDSEGADASVLNKIVRGPKIAKSAIHAAASLVGTGVKCVDFLSALVMAWGQYIYSFNTGTAHWDNVLDTGSAITDILAVGPYLLIAHGLAAAYTYWDGANHVTSSRVVKNIKYFSLVGDTIWASSSNYQVVYDAATNYGLNGGAWSTTTTIGNSTSTVITGLLSHPVNMYVGTQEGPYQVNADGTVTILDSVFHSYTHAYTCKNMLEANGMVYIPTGTGDLFEWSTADSGVGLVSPWIWTGNIAAHTGKVLAMAHDNWFIYAVLDHGTALTIMRGRWEYMDKVLSWVWHPVGEITGLTNSSNNCESCYISNLGGSLRLWIICTDHEDGCYYVHIPTNYANPDADTAFYFNASATWYSSLFRGGKPDTDKCWYRLGLRLSGVSATLPLSFYYRTTNSGSWTEFDGSPITDGDYVLLAFPDDTYARQMQFKAVMDGSSDATASCVIESISVYYAEYAAIESGEQRFSINDRWEFVMYGGSDTFWQHLDYHDTVKAFFTISVQSFGVTVDKPITVSYKIDNGPWLEIQDRISEGPWQTLAFPASTYGKIISLNFTRTDEDTTEMLAYKIAGKLMPDKQRQFSFTACLAGSEINAAGGMSRRSIDDLALLLRQIDNEKWPVYMETFEGHKVFVTFDEMREQCVYTGPDRNPEYWYSIIATEARL